MTSPQEEPRVLAAQMGRPLVGRSEVVSRCDLGVPVAIRVHPVLEDGRPFPTLYYLTCPLARTRIARLEHAGEVRRLTERAARDPDFGAALEAAQVEYARERDAALAPDDPARARLTGGVGGARGGVKCVHAHYAHLRAGRANPVGEAVRDRVEPLDCAAPCVRDGAPNPAWREPASPTGDVT